MIRLGVDFGGTKIEAAAIDADGRFLARRRVPNPGAYDAAVVAVRDLVEAVAAQAGAGPAPLGVGGPGSVSPVTGRIRNANSTWLNGRPFVADLRAALGRPVAYANDANCFALSEATDGAATGAASVFGVIVGTGCGGGVVIDGRLVEGVNGIAGEWGHLPLPWPTPEEGAVAPCWCGRRGCLETFLSGPALARDGGLPAEALVAAARAGEPAAGAALDRYLDRLGRALAMVCDILDPEVVVFGGGLSNLDEIYARVPAIAATHVFSDTFAARLVKATHGDSSGVRGAAWLWDGSSLASPGAWDDNTM